MKVLFALSILILTVCCEAMTGRKEMTMSHKIMSRNRMMEKRMSKDFMMNKRDMEPVRMSIFEEKKPLNEVSQPVKRHSHEASFLSKRNTMQTAQNTRSRKRHSHEASFLAKRESMGNLKPEIMKRHSHEASFLA
ncbi:hypothetical protein BpHYR1_036763 [Brachionus plicatilis]|uniref:Uncharacterized protein n=1 Tax=Brachionus plicatilis TaxID=10195 RepID=A0A3M7T033_BRAPC|nr:hypothetical protein BpHYR1_036763 [Brachionus plicatilis]